MKKLIFILLFFISLSGYSQFVTVIAPIGTNGVALYPTHIDSLGKGGFRVTQTLAERNAITTLRRKAGMWVFVTDSNKVYYLNGGITNSDWAEVVLGGSGGSGGGSIRIGVLDSLPGSSNGASSLGNNLYLQLATQLVPGLLSAADKAKIDSLRNVYWYAIQKSGYLSTAYRPNDSTIYAKALLLSMPAEFTVTPSTTDTTGTWTVTWSGAAGGGPYWGLTGNSGTTPGTNFIGTTDAAGFQVKTNNTRRIDITSAGLIGIGEDAISDARVVIRGSGATSSTYSLVARNSAAENILRVDDAGNGYIGNVITQTSTNILYGTNKMPNMASGVGTKAVRINPADGTLTYADTTTGGGGGSGTVTSVATGYGLSGGTITTTGTLAIDTTLISTRLWRQKGIDSINTLLGLKVNISDTATMLSKYIKNINGLTGQIQTLAVGTSGSDFAISSSGSTHTFNLPTASASNRGALSSTDWSTFNNKQATISGTTNRITVSSNVVDISSSYVGQSSITTLGTVTTGTLGTGAVIGGVTMTLGSDATGDLHYRNSSGVLTRLGIGTTRQRLGIVGGLPAWVDTTAVPTVTPAALTKTDDTNVTLTLGGTPSTSLLQATSITAGWTGSLSIARGGTNNGSLAVTNGSLLYTDGSKVVSLGVGTTRQKLGVVGGVPAWVDSTAAGTGTVTSIATTSPLGGGTITGTGTITLDTTTTSGGWHSKNYYDTKFVHLTGTETVAGAKTFSNDMTLGGVLNLPNSTVLYSTSTNGVSLGNGASAIYNGGTATNFITIGTDAGKYIKNGSSSIYIGKLNHYLIADSTADSNVGVGANQSGYGSYNTYFGHEISQTGTSGDANTAVGYRAIANKSTGSSNTAIGSQSMTNLTSGVQNTAIGTYSGYGVVGGSRNLFLGDWAGAYLSNTSDRGVIQTGNAGSLSTGTIIMDFANRYVGINKTQDATLAYQLTVGGKAAIETIDSTGTGTAINMLYQDPSTGLIKKAAVPSSSGGTPAGNYGNFQLNRNGVFAVAASDSVTYTTSGGFVVKNEATIHGATFGLGLGAQIENVAAGSGALAANTSGTRNTAMGYRSLFVNTDGYYNTALGYQALTANIHGAANTAIGHNTLVNQTGDYSVGVGSSALQLNTASGNTAVGTLSSQLNTSSGQITSVGFQSLQNSTGADNTAIGYNSGAGNTTGHDNIYVGYGSGGGITTGSNNTVIGPATGLSSSLASNIILANGAGTIKAQHDGTDWTFTGKANVTGRVYSGVAGTTLGGYDLSGNTSGTISILPQAAAGTYNFNLPTTAGTTGQVLTSQGGGSSAMTWTTPSGSGTVTATGGSLTSNSVVLGAGTTDTKVVSGITTDGTSVLNLGVNATTIGKVKLYGNTSGDATIQPAAVAGTATVITLPAVTGTLATLANSETLTNKRWTARVGSTTSSATPTINTDSYDIYKLTAQTADITSMTTNLSGTPVDGDILEIQITGTAARAITWGSSFVSSTVTLPTTTVTTATLTVVLQYYTTSSYGNNKWVCVNSY